MHIEQGPVLESEGLALGSVTTVSGANRLKVEIRGEPGHAGTVPMKNRHDALVAASECVLAVSEIAEASPNTVGTVGQLTIGGGGASNVIPGNVSLSVDIRAADDEARWAAVTLFEGSAAKIAERRSVQIDIDRVHEASSVDCAPWIIEQIDRVIVEQGGRPFQLPSGAGHDAAAMSDVTDVGMIFVRCRGGVSHCPTESIAEEDAVAGAHLLSNIVRNFRRQTVS